MSFKNSFSLSSWKDILKIKNRAVVSKTSHWIDSDVNFDAQTRIPSLSVMEDRSLGSYENLRETSCRSAIGSCWNESSEVYVSEMRLGFLSHLTCHNRDLNFHLKLYRPCGVSGHMSILIELCELNFHIICHLFVWRSRFFDKMSCHIISYHITYHVFRGMNGKVRDDQKSIWSVDHITHHLWLFSEGSSNCRISRMIVFGMNLSLSNLVFFPSSGLSRLKCHENHNWIVKVETNLF
jgi:hypothetical protein